METAGCLYNFVQMTVNLEKLLLLLMHIILPLLVYLYKYEHICIYMKEDKVENRLECIVTEDDFMHRT